MRAILPLLLLSACSTFSLQPLGDQLTAMKGQPVETAFHQLGYPDRQETIAGRTVYYWGDDKSTCSIKLVSTPDGKVDSGTIFGSPAGCSRFRH